MPLRNAGETLFRKFEVSTPPKLPWDQMSEHGRSQWAAIEDYIIAEHLKPQPGWREQGEQDPHGERYNCPQKNIAGGQLTDDQAAIKIAMLARSDLNFEGVLAIAKDRIRWLSRQVASMKAQLLAAAREIDRLRVELGTRASTITRLEQHLTARDYRRLQPDEIPDHDFFLIWSPNRPRWPVLVNRHSFAGSRASNVPADRSMLDYTHWAPLVVPISNDGAPNRIGAQMQQDTDRLTAAFDAPVASPVIA